MEDKRSLKDLLGLITAIVGISGLVASGVITLFSFYTEISTIPERLDSLERMVEIQISGTPQLIDFSGNGIINRNEVAPGEVINIVYVLRRNVSCDTNIRVRWWNMDTNNFEPGPVVEIPSIRAAVTTTYSPFSVPVRIPEWLPEGNYTYLPEIVPLNCGIYGTIIPPMSDVIEVRN